MNMYMFGKADDTVTQDVQDDDMLRIHQARG